MTNINYSDAPDWLQWIIGAGIVVAFVVMLIRLVPPIWRFVRKAAKLTDSLDTLPESLAAQALFRENITESMRKVNHELAPNGGSSMKDQGNRTEAAVKLQGRQLASLKTTIARTEKKLDTHLEDSAVIVRKLKESHHLESEPTL